MGTGTVDRVGAPAPRWLRWLGASNRAEPRSAQAQIVEQLESELALLREENARLKVKQVRAERSLTERVRELLPPHDEAGSADETWELLTDCLLLRDGLIDACREIELGVRATRERLDALFSSSVLERERLAASEEPVVRGDFESAA